ncbi:hypothetical protein LINPERHAP1_LOCUS21951 [Linum perenne]
MCEAFPRVAAIAQASNALVSDYYSFDDRCRWVVAVAGTLRGGAEAERLRLLQLLESLPLGTVSAGPPALRWTLEPKGVFTVRSMARQLSGCVFGGFDDFPAEVIWRKHVPSKVAAFVWQASLNNISTIDNLVRRGFQFPNRCIMCESEAESIRHLFFECSFSSQVWSLLSSRLSIFGPLPRSLLGILAAWKGWNWDRDFEACGRVLLHGVCWFIWLERNARMFRDECSSWEKVAIRIGRTIGEWCVSAGLLATPHRSRWLACFRPVREPD